MSKRVMFVFGTRPEAIKIAPIIRMAKRNPELEVCVCSTGQHREMLASVLSVFEIVPDFDFGLMKPGQTLKDITVAVLDKLTAIIHHKKPDWIVVQGDTTTAMAGFMKEFEWPTWKQASALATVFLLFQKSSTAESRHSLQIFILRRLMSRPKTS